MRADWRSLCVDRTVDRTGKRMSTAEIWQLVDARSIGGIERHVSELTRALNAHGVPARAVLYAPHEPNLWLGQLQNEGTPHRVLPGGARALLRAMLEDRPAVVHTHGYKAGIVGRACARLLGIPAVSTFHAGETGRWPINAYQAFDAATSLLAKRISVSGAIAARLPFSSDTIANFVTLPPVDLTAQLPRRAAFVGRLSEEKGPDLFCDIARGVGSTVQWDVYGDGPMRSALETEYGSVVRFHGFVSDMNAVWKDVGLLVMPSRAEGLPMAALEALARGIPVAASSVGGLPSLLDPIGPTWLYPAGDIDAAVRSVRHWRSLAPSSEATLRATCRNVVERSFSAAGILPKVLGVYRSAGWRPAGSSTMIVQSSICSGIS